ASNGASSIVALTPDGKHFVDGQATMVVREVATGNEIRSMKVHKRGVKAIAICEDGKTVITGDFDGNALVWDLNTAEVRSTLKVGDDLPVESVAITGDAKRAVTGSLGGQAKVWDVGAKKVVAAS